MKIVIDANIIYTNSLIRDSLPKALKDFLDQCSKNKHEIIIALTTKLEFDRKQKELRDKEISELKKAERLLSKYNVKIGQHELEKLIAEPDLIQLIKQCKVNVSVVEPEHDDFMYAHKKACLHLPPHPPDIKSDEMRDLVVWRIALRTSSMNKGNTILLSNDELHTHSRGNSEAEEYGLVRVNSLESALEYMEVETPNGKFVRNLLDLSWEKLFNSGLPVKDKPSISGIQNVRFIQGSNGPSEVVFRMKTIGQENKVLWTDIKVKIENNVITTIILSNIKSGDDKIEDIQIELDAEINTFENDYNQRIESLREILKSNL